MSEGNFFNELMGRFSRKPDSGSMNEHERKAEGMAEDLRSSLNKAIPKDPRHGYTLVQWAVRTSMKEIENFSALDKTIESLGENEIKELAKSTGKSVDELKKLYKEKGDRTDRESVRSSYVIVECNIDHNNLKNSSDVARRFLDILHQKVNKHNPNSEDISTDELTSLSEGQKPKRNGALFEGVYTFGSK
jgi:hypothetical protein